MVEARQKSSPFWRLIHLLGSLQLALILLATIAIACAVATVAESEFSTKVAQVYIYKAPWFLIWLGVLCTNLFAVTITRWPWEKKHTGFIITHYGIITLLFGAIVGLQTGFEGNVTLHKDKPPVRKITINRSIIQVESPNDTGLYVMPFDATSARPSEKRPRTFGSQNCRRCGEREPLEGGKTDAFGVGHTRCDASLHKSAYGPDSQHATCAGGG